MVYRMRRVLFTPKLLVFSFISTCEIKIKKYEKFYESRYLTVTISNIPNDFFPFNLLISKN